METVGKFMLSIIFGALAVISQAYAAVILWRWFVIPVFHLPPLTWSIAYGFILLFGVIHNIPSPDRKDDSFSTDIARMIANRIIWPWISVGIGWMIK